MVFDNGIIMDNHYVYTYIYIIILLNIIMVNSNNCEFMAMFST